MKRLDRSHWGDVPSSWCPNEHGGDYLVSLALTAALAVLFLRLTGVIQWP